MKIYGKLFDRAMMMCRNDDDKDYMEALCMYRDFVNKDYNSIKPVEELQLKFLTENWGKLEEKCPHLMYNYYLLVDEAMDTEKEAEVNLKVDLNSKKIIITIETDIV